MLTRPHLHIKYTTVHYKNVNTLCALTIISQILLDPMKMLAPSVLRGAV